MGDLESHKAGGDDRRPKLCFLQSTGNSPLPQVDITPGLRADIRLHEDVADLESTARLEDACYLLHGRELVGEQIQHAVRDDDIGPTVGDRKRLGESLVKVNIRESTLGRACSGTHEHRWCHVDTDDLALSADHAGCDEAVDAGAASDIDDVLAFAEDAEQKRVTGSGEGCDAVLRHAIEPGVIVSENSGQPAAGVEMEFLTRIGGNVRVLLSNGGAQFIDVEPVDASAHAGQSALFLALRHRALLTGVLMIGYSIDH